jgi:stress-induced morphogen
MSPEMLKTRLKTAYPDGQIEVFDLTGTGNHFEVSVESSLFKGMNRIKQHQSVMAVFQAELKTGEVHALSIKTKIKE